MIESIQDVSELLQSCLEDYYKPTTEKSTFHTFGSVIAKVYENDPTILKVLKKGVTDEALKQELISFYKNEISSDHPQVLEDLQTKDLNYCINRYGIYRNFSPNEIKFSMDEKRVYEFLHCAYRNLLRKIEDKFNSDLSHLSQQLKNIIDHEDQFKKYGLLRISNDRELLALNPPRIYDKTTDSTYFINTHVSIHFWKTIDTMLKNEKIKDFYVRLKNQPGYSHRYNEEVVFEELERGQYLNLSNLDKIHITKLYSKNYNDTLWIKIDQENITFEEMCDDFDTYKNTIVTQVIHLKYFKENNEYFIAHLDHEYIFYTVDEYMKREKNPNQKGEAKPRIKSFKIDNARIPLNFMIEVNHHADDNDSCISQQEPFLYYVLDSYFKHKDLLKEYFQNVK